jgi:hypothetical protein
MFVASHLPKLFYDTPLTLILSAIQTLSFSLLEGKLTLDGCLHSFESMANFEQPELRHNCVVQILKVVILNVISEKGVSIMENK